MPPSPQLVYISLWLQSIGGLSPLQAGCVFIPLSAFSFGVAAVRGPVPADAARPGSCWAADCCSSGAGCLLMTLVTADSTWRCWCPGLAVLGVGVGIANPTLASAALAAVPRERSGMASGAVNTARQLGFAVGVAVLGTVFATGATAALRDAGTPRPVRCGVGAARPGRRRLLRRAGPPARAGVADAAREPATPPGWTASSSPAG